MSAFNVLGISDCWVISAPMSQVVFSLHLSPTYRILLGRKYQHHNYKEEKRRKWEWVSIRGIHWICWPGWSLNVKSWTMVICKMFENPKNVCLPFVCSKCISFSWIIEHLAKLRKISSLLKVLANHPSWVSASIHPQSGSGNVFVCFILMIHPTFYIFTTWKSCINSGEQTNQIRMWFLRRTRLYP